MLDPHVTRFPPTPLRTIVLSAYRKTGPASLARRASDDCRLSSNREGRSDCVILLDHRVTGQISTRRLRVVKYRGSRHGTNEYPFLIDNGIVVLPITSIGLENVASTKRISSGIPQRDAMLGGDTVSIAAAPCSFRGPVARARQDSPPALPTQPANEASSNDAYDRRT